MNSTSEATGAFASYRAGMILLAGYVVLLTKFGPMPEAILIMLAVFLAAVASSIAGFAFSAICGALLFHLIDDPVRAVEIMMICSVGGQATMVWSLRRNIDWQGLSNFLVGGAFGLPVGIYLLMHANPKLYMHLIGALLVLYAGFMIFRRPVVLVRQRGLWDVLAGFLGGITGGLAAFPGAPVTIWCGFKGWNKERQRGLYQPFILILQLAGLFIMAAGDFAGIQHRGFDWSGFLYLPAMLLGTSLGMALFAWMNDRQFARSVNILLVVSGVSFLL
jgi:uncharacterized membrane protein YfcA